MTRESIKPEQVKSLQIVRQLLPWREQLATSFGTAHGNAKLELIDVLIVMLAGFYNPMVRSQRLLDALSSQAWLAEQTGVQRVARSTLSDALRRFDPEALRPLIDDLTGRIPALRRRDADLAEVTRQVLAVDGSVFNLAGEVAWAIGCRRGRSDTPQSRVRLDLHLDVRTFSPVDLGVAGRDEGHEAAAMRKRIRPDVVYVLDRGYLHFGLLHDLLDAGSNFVLRLRKNTCFAPGNNTPGNNTPANNTPANNPPGSDGVSPLTDADREHGVQRDEVGRLTGGKTLVTNAGGTRHYTAAPPEQTLRRVTVWDEKNQCELVLLTDLLDLPAHVIATLYRHRWQVELFFKWLKSYAHFDHLVSKSAKGVTFQFYVAVIATLLLHLATGRRVNKYALFWLGSVASGRATFEEMQAGLARIEREKALERARLARKKAAAKTNP